ncbi:MAG: hypothetical protein CVV41_17475 [Candidatus Riflebacteria bacterium HGW-Riflebacteria-1]|jgi:prepilin-type N-terminal cleavage/methylation domain-containing protein|nr:MAG: hypothetical protein CVV42_21270 [Candidatus Riflebacteria bacterium HGW-Riflebacteria-2]PKL41726.1 MAG: hypothetical protein CVV41_17475 [Candidatus Riflebacteria bacterium HGW-Riflebacteria-1]
MNLRRGLSLVEIMVASVVIALAVGPLLGLLSSSNRMSNASIYEEMAVHYAREICDQLLSLGQRESEIVNDARIMTGNPSISLGSILNDSGFQARLEEHGDNTKVIPLQTNGTSLPVRFTVSPLNKVFSRRRITATTVNSSTNSIMKGENYLKIRVQVAWKASLSGNDSSREVNMAVFLKEN